MSSALAGRCFTLCHLGSPRAPKLPFNIWSLASTLGHRGGSGSKESACSAGDPGQEDPLEKEMATHSSILAWEIPWTEASSKLQSMRLERVSHSHLVSSTAGSPVDGNDQPSWHCLRHRSLYPGAI